MTSIPKTQLSVVRSRGNNGRVGSKGKRPNSSRMRLGAQQSLASLASVPNTQSPVHCSASNQGSIRRVSTGQKEENNAFPSIRFFFPLTQHRCHTFLLPRGSANEWLLQHPTLTRVQREQQARDELREEQSEQQALRQDQPSAKAFLLPKHCKLQPSRPCYKSNFSDINEHLFSSPIQQMQPGLLSSHQH